MNNPLNALSKEALIELLHDARKEIARLSGIEHETSWFSDVLNQLRDKSPSDNLNHPEIYKLFFESMTIGGYFSTPEGRFLHVNPAMLKILGYNDLGELKQLNISTDVFVNSTDRDEILKIASKKDFTIATYLIKNRDGDKLWIEDHIRFIRNKNGDVDFVEGICQDVTLKKEVELSLQLSEERFRMMAEMLPQAVWEADISGTFTYVNPAGYRITGYEARDVEAGKLSVFNVLTPEERVRAASNVKELFAGSYNEGREYIGLKKDGTKFPVIIYSALIKTNGVISGIRGITVDISEVREKEGDYLATSAQLQAVLNAATEVSIIAVDTSGIIRIFNKGAEKILEYISDEVVGKISPIKFHLKSELDALSRELFMETGNVYNGFDVLVARAGMFGIETREWTYITKKRKKITVSLVVSVVKNSNGLIIGYLGVGRNVTEQKIAEKTLRESEQKYKSLFENLSDAVFFMNNHIFLECNARINEIFKCQKADIIGCSPVKFSPPHQPDGQSSAEKAAGYIQSAMNGNPQFFEWVHRALDGSDFYTEVSLNRIKIGDEFLVQAIVRDIDERKKSEMKLFKSKQLFQTLASISPVGIFRTGPNGKTTYVNPKWTELSGLSAKEAMDDDWILAVHPDDRQILIQSWKERTSRGERSAAEYRFMKPDGTIVWVMGYAVPEIIDDKIKGYVGTITDISERKRAEIELQDKNQLIESQNEEYLQINEELIQLNEELMVAKERAEESDRLKSAFLANMSHEIRTPLNGIIGFAHVLSALDLTETERKEYTDTLHLSCNRLLNTVNDILDISKIDAGQAVVNVDFYNPKKLLEELYSLQMPNFKKKNVELRLKYRSDLSKIRVFGDEQKVYQVVNNLLDNACKFTKEGYVEFGATVINDKIEFYVADTGIGIDEERLEFVFGRFNQENLTLNRDHEGSGLGLAITKGLVDLMDGKIHLKSKKGKGSVFKIVLPLTFLHEYGTGINGSDIEDVEMNVSIDGSVLVAEDDDVNYQLMYNILAAASIKKIVRARTGLEAVDMLMAKKDITLVLMDLKMPGMDGYEAIKSIRATNKEVTIVVISAFSLPAEEQMAYDAGCNGFITKPYNPANVIRRIKAEVANNKKSLKQ